MQSPYQNDSAAQSYLDFLDSDDGQIFQQVISETILRRLKSSLGLTILDAGCGSGWLSGLLADAGHRVKGCDISPLLLAKARSLHPEIDFQLCDLTKKLPYANAQFDCVILSLSAPDLQNQNAAYSEIKRIMKDGGRLIIITVNPYYGFPVGVWKRGLLGWLTRRKPILRLRSYFDFARKADRSFRWNNGKLTSYFYTLPEQINTLVDLGFSLHRLEDIEIQTDEKKYNLQHRLYRFPIFLMLEWIKP